MLMFYLAAIVEEDDRQLFEKIYIRYSDDIFRRVYGIVKNQADAEDVVQDTWQKLCEHIEEMRGKEDRSVRAYIMSIAKNRSFDLLRRRKREMTVEDDIGSFDIADETAFFDACEKCTVEQILECMKELGEIYCDVLVYYYFHKHTLKEIALFMGINESTVGSRLTRGRAKLIELMKRRGICG
jgi:RNA polymerase sigma-70 factor (ECF subfamily)